MKKLYTYIGRYWYGYLFAVFSMVTAIVLDMLYPKITQQIVDDVIIGGKLELLTKLLVGIVIVGIGRSIFGYCKEFTFDVLASKIGSAMRKDLFDHIQSLSMGYFEDTNTGETDGAVSRMTWIKSGMRGLCGHACHRGYHSCVHGTVLHVFAQLEAGVRAACHNDPVRYGRDHHGAQARQDLRGHQ